MAFFQITVILKDLTKHVGILENETASLDSAFKGYRFEAHKAYGRDNIEYFNCVGLSNLSEEVKPFLKKKGRSKETIYTQDYAIDPVPPEDMPPPDRPPTKGPGKYRAG